MKIFLFIFFFVSVSFSIVAQKTQKIARLPEIVTESSGLIFYNDSLLITHNDSGDKPVLYVVNLKGKLVHQVVINNANNVDWEDITKDDKGNIYDAIFPHYNMVSKIRTGKELVENLTGTKILESIGKSDCGLLGLSYYPADKQTQQAILHKLLKHLKNMESHLKSGKCVWGDGFIITST